MLQNGPKMVPTWSQNRPKMTPSWCQDGPKRAQKDPKKQQKLENEEFEAPRGAYPQIQSPLGAQVGPQVDPFWTKIGDFLPTCLRRRFFIDFWWFLGGLRTFIFWFSPKRKHNFHIFVKVFVGIVFDSQNPPKIRPNRPQEGSKVDQKSDRKICWVWDRFLDDFWSVFGPPGGTDSRRSRRQNRKNPSSGPGRVPRHPKYSKIIKKWAPGPPKSLKIMRIW